MPVSDLAMAWSKTRKADTTLLIFGILTLNDTDLIFSHV